MNKRRISWIAGLLFLTWLVAYCLLWRQRADRDGTAAGPTTPEEVVEAARKWGHPLPAPVVAAKPKAIDMRRPVRLAIGSLGMTNEEQERTLNDLVLADLTGAPGLALVERQSLEAVLGELHLNLSGLVRAKDAVRAGKLLKADWFLLGTKSKINGTNSRVLVRLVDAGTGILRDAEVVPADGTTLEAAKGIARFVRQSRQNAAEPKLRNFLAIGGFADLSLNNRQAGFPDQLRSYLTAAYQKSDVTLLEREAADSLFQEVCLDLAGLTDEGGAKAPPPMQSAYWLVDGSYQSLENSNSEVEVALDVAQMFGPWDPPQVVFRGRPGEAFLQELKAGIDTRMKNTKAWVMPTRLSEARAQLDMGKRLLPLGMGGRDEEFERRFGLIRPESEENPDEQESARRRHNAEQAVHAFESVLLIEPTNRETKLYLAACFRRVMTTRADEAKDLYREIIDAPEQDNWTSLAQQSLAAYFERWKGPEEKARWFSLAAETATNPVARDFYRHHAESATADAALQNAEGPKLVELREKRLMEILRDRDGFHDGRWFHGMDDFMETFGTNKAAGAARLARLLPQMEAVVSNLSPHLVAIALGFQTDTNTPVLAEFRRVMDSCIEHPAGITKSDWFWHSARHETYHWLCQQKLYSDAVKLMEGFETAEKNSKEFPLNHEDQMALAFAYKGAERWKEALAVFQSFKNTPLRVNSDEVWWQADAPVQTGQEANDCREKLGLAAVHDPREIVKVSSRSIRMETFSSWAHYTTFATDVDGLWLAAGDRLIHLDWNLKTNFSEALPKSLFTAVYALCVSPSEVWVGTGGDGLIDFDKTTHRCRHFTVEDGLAMNIISCLSLAENELWIGYGHKYSYDQNGAPLPAGGGIGRLDLLSKRLVSFMPSLADGPAAHEHLSGNSVTESPAKPTRRVVREITAGADGAVWFLDEQGGLRRFQSRENVWDSAPAGGRSLLLNGARMFVGRYSWELLNPHMGRGPLGVEILDLRDGQRTSVDNIEGLPTDEVSAIAMNGDDLWAGGLGYIALLDAKQNQIRKFAYIGADTIDRIQIGGGFVWVQCNGWLSRLSLAGAP